MRPRHITLAVAAMLLGAAVNAAASPAAAAPAPAAPVPDSAMRLSKLLNPGDKLVDIAMRGFEAGVDAALKKNPDDAKLFDANPGLLQSIVEAGKPIVRRHVEAAVPAHQRTFAEFYARKFSPGELQQLIDFYSTPTGNKVISGMYNGADLGKMAEAMSEKGDGAVTSEAIREFTSSTGAKLLPGFDADDWKALFIFAATPGYAKMKSVAPEFQQLTADLANQPDPAMDAELDKAVEAAVGNYMARKKAAK